MSETGPSLQRPATRAARLSAIEQALATHIITDGGTDAIPKRGYEEKDENVEMQIQPGRDFSLVAVYVDGHDEELRVPVDNVDPVPQSVAKAAMGLLFDRIDGHKTGERLLVSPHITIRS